MASKYNDTKAHPEQADRILHSTKANNINSMLSHLKNIGSLFNCATRVVF